ncbi:hypothetical protein Ndes2526B_g04076 [Nannochloris sp. 'desiccata']
MAYSFAKASLSLAVSNSCQKSNSKVTSSRFSSRKPLTVVAATRNQDSSWYEVEDMSPPPTRLGVHDLPKNTHNGDTITIEVEAQAQDYVVQRTVLRYKLERGRYRPKERRLEVRKTGRFLYNKFLENVYNLDVNQS